MAVTKIHAVNATEIKALEYIVNPEKTQGGLLVGSYACSKIPVGAHEDFARIQSTKTGKNRILSHHIIQSFEGQEVTSVQTLAIGSELCKKYLKDSYQYVTAVRTDTDNVHCHIIFNNVSMVNEKLSIQTKHRTLKSHGENSMKLVKKIRS